MPDKDWYIYILKCEDGSLYTGVTTDIDRRFREHKEGTASKYTKSFGADEIVYTETKSSKGAALSREAEIKALSRNQKKNLFAGE